MMMMMMMMIMLVSSGICCLFSCEQTSCTASKSHILPVITCLIAVLMVLITAIVLHYSAHIKPSKMIKTIKTDNIIH